MNLHFFGKILRVLLSQYLNLEYQTVTKEAAPEISMLKYLQTKRCDKQNFTTPK